MRVKIQNNILFHNALKKHLPTFNIREFAGLSIDSRKVIEGDIFLALKGHITDGCIMFVGRSFPEYK